MDDHSHIWLVDAHAEGVGGRHDAKTSGDEAILSLLLGIRFQLGVEISGFQSFIRQESCNVFCCFA